ncbi:MAG TPA: cytochrome c oxidase subunit 3 [Bacteriovoracaceae bacterium]|nr:cytochrome c oxidase subunit 3 [Bacteriovoracaceae bacterium]
MNRSQSQNNLAMTIVLISGAMLFATLFMGYAIYRTSAPTWPPMGSTKVSLGLPFLATLTILLSSWFCHRVQLAVKVENFARASMELNMTLGLGFVFLFIQSSLWFHMKNVGLYTSSGIFASILYAYTWIHAVHVVLGLFSLIWLRVVLRPSNARILQKTINVERFWHFLGIVWIIMFLTLFVL